MPSIIYGMVTYCIGSARQKRAYFAESGDNVVLDNVEVLFCASENGRNCFAIGDVPFATFTVAEYLNYRRALCREKAPISMLERFGISENTRLGRLTPVEMRCVAFLEKTAGRTESPVVVNLDGARYTRREAELLNNLLKTVSVAYVCVTDRRFVKKRPPDAKVLTFGNGRTGGRPTFYSARLLAKRIGAKRVSIV